MYNSCLGAFIIFSKAHFCQTGAFMCRLQAWLQIYTVVCASNLCGFAMCGLLGSIKLRCKLRCSCAGCCALAGVILWIIIMTVLEVWAALAPALHRLASLSRRLAAVFRERQVRIMAHTVEDPNTPCFVSTQLFPPLLLTNSPLAS